MLPFGILENGSGNCQQTCVTIGIQMMKLMSASMTPENHRLLSGEGDGQENTSEADR